MLHRSCDCHNGRIITRYSTINSCQSAVSSDTLVTKCISSDTASFQNLYRRIPSRFVSRHSLVTIPFHSVAFHISTTCGPISPAVARDSVCSRLRRDWLDPNSRHKRSSKSCGRATYWLHTISSTRNQNQRRTNLPIGEIFQRKCVFIAVAALTVKQLKHILSVSQLF